MESLIKAGCFDKLEINRAKLLFNLPRIISFVESEKNNENQGSLFDDMFSNGEEALNIDIQLDDYPSFTTKELLTYEKQAIGYYLTASLFDDYNEVIQKLDVYPLSKIHLEDEDVQEILNAKYAKYKPKILICGIINYMGARPTKKGGKISFIKVEDASGELEFVVFNELLEKSTDLLKIDNLVFVRGEVIYDTFREQVKINASEILTLDDVLAQQVNWLKVELNNKMKIDDILQLINDSVTGAKIKGGYSNNLASCNFTLAEQFKFNLSLENLQQLSSLVGKSNWGFELNKV